MSKDIKGISIKIGADTTPLNKALSDVDRKANDTQTELKKLNTALKFNPNNIVLATQKQELLTKQVANTKEKLQKLKSAEADVQDQFKKGKITEEQYRAYQREIVETESKLKHYENQLKSVTSNHSKFAQKMQDVSPRLSNVGSKMTNTGTKLTKGVTTPLIALGGASLKAFGEVDSALDTVTTKTGATGKSLESLHDSTKKIATDIPSDFDEVGNAVGEVNTQFGFMGDKLEKSTEQIIKFAQINGQDVTSSTIASKAAIEAYDLQAKDLNGVLDAVTKSAQNTGVGTDKIFDSVTKGAPQLKALKLNFSQSAEMMARFEQKGIDSSRALSYMSKAQVTFAKEGKTLGQGMSELTKKIKSSSSETEQLSLASEYFGTKGASVMLDAIKRGAFDFEDFEDASKNAKGSVSKTFENTQDLIKRFKKTLNSAKETLTEIAEPLQETLKPALKDAGDHLKELSKKFKNLSPEQKKMITKIGLTAAAIGPLLVEGGKVSTGISRIIDLGGKLNPKIGGFIGKTGPKLTGFFGKSEKLMLKSSKKMGGLLGKGGKAIGKFAKIGGKKLGTFFGGVGKKIVGIAKLFGVKGLVIGLAIGAVVTAGVLLYKNWDKVMEKAHELHEKLIAEFEKLKVKTKEKFQQIKEAMIKPFIEAKGKVVAKAQELKTSLSNKWESIKTTTRNKFNSIKNAMIKPFTDARNNIHEKIDSIKSKFNNLKLKEIKIPHIKLPEFHLKGDFSLKNKTVPELTTTWHAQGGIFTSPTLLPSVNGGLHGVGEAGPEAILPLSVLNGIVENAMRRVQNTYNSTTKATTINEYAPPQQVNTFQIGAEKVGTVIVPTVTYSTAMNQQILKGALGV